MHCLSLRAALLFPFYRSTTPFPLPPFLSATGTSLLPSTAFFPLFLIFFMFLLLCSSISLSLPVPFNWILSHFFLLCTTCQILHLYLNFCPYPSTTYVLRFLLAVFSPTGHSTVISPHPVKSLTLQPQLGLHSALRFRFMESSAVCKVFCNPGSRR